MKYVDYSFDNPTHIYNKFLLIFMFLSINNTFNRLKCWLLVAAISLFVSQFASAQYLPYSYNSETIRGIQYFEYTHTIIELGPDPIDYPSLSNLREFGFVLNDDDEETYIAPDGAIVPKFHDALWVVSRSADNCSYPAPEGAPDTYTGSIYLRDFIEGFINLRDEYILGFDAFPFADEIISVRTPKYAVIQVKNFFRAVNMQKVQIGACYSVRPYAFMNCAKLEDVIFENAPFVHDDAFSTCSALKNIVLQKGLPMLNSDAVFEQSVYNNATLYLSDELMQECMNDPVWSKFAHKQSLKDCKVDFMYPTK